MRSLWALWVAVRASWAVLRQNRVRSLLTLAVCGLGTAGVLVAGLLGRASVAAMEERLRVLGGRLVVVSPNKRPPYPGRPRQLDHFISLEPQDADALAAALPQLEAVVPLASRNLTIRQEGRAARVRLIGTRPGYLRVRAFSLARGRFLCGADDGERVVVLGHAVSQELSPEGVRPGDRVALAGQPYEVVGVLSPQGVNFAGEDEDHQAFVPLETYRVRIANRPWLSALYLQLSPDVSSEATITRVQALLRERHERRPDEVEDVVVRDLADLAGRQSDLLTTTRWAVAVTGGLLLALGVAGIGALMLLVVRQRRGEIGLRRALGASPTDVALQFFVEGLLLALLGVLAGLGVGAAGWLIASGVTSAAVPLDAASLGLAAGASLVASAATCVVPAVVAARLEPAAALRD